MSIYDLMLDPKFNLEKYIEIKDKEIKKLNNIIKIMEKYFELIVDLGYDYDGFNTVESLKALIDELRRYASLGRVYNTTEPIFINNDKKYNILNEELKEEEKKISEKLEYYDDSIAWVIDDVGQLSDVDKVIIDKLNNIIDYLKSKGE